MDDCGNIDLEGLVRTGINSDRKRRSERGDLDIGSGVALVTRKLSSRRDIYDGDLLAPFLTASDSLMLCLLAIGTIVEDCCLSI